MKKMTDVLIGLTAIGVAAVVPAAAQAQTASPSGTDQHVAAVDSILGGATVTLKVDGMTCPFCAYGLERRLRRLSAVDSVVVRVSDGLVQIREKDGQALPDETLQREVEKAGFSLREIARTEI